MESLLVVFFIFIFYFHFSSFLYLFFFIMIFDINSFLYYNLGIYFFLVRMCCLFSLPTLTSRSLQSDRITFSFLFSFLSFFPLGLEALPP
jgi:hypothetical protein